MRRKELWRVGIDVSDTAQEIWLFILVWVDVNKEILSYRFHKAKIKLSFYVFQGNLSDSVN